MTVRGGGVPTCFLGFQCRKGEWVRRFGASLPMRMTASWFGSLDPPNTRLWRDPFMLHGLCVIVRYLDFYNGRRPHSSLDGMTPDRAHFNSLLLRLAAKPRQTLPLSTRNSAQT